LTPEICTRTRTWPAVVTGTQRSTSRRMSGPPVWEYTMALI